MEPIRSFRWNPNTRRWQQHAEWTAELPARNITNISIGVHMWDHFGNADEKLTESFRPSNWANESVTEPRRDDGTRQALATAVRIVQVGRGRATRQAVARVMANDRL